jgi:hypothetical protein
VYLRGLMPRLRREFRHKCALRAVLTGTMS